MPLNPTLIWLLAGIALCLTELVFPTAFIAFVVGLSALIVAAISVVLPIFTGQIILWVAISLLLVAVSRRFVRTRAAFKLDATEAETLTEIPPGKVGRVRYEGNSWQARCEDGELAIAPHQKVVVVARQGTTLIVIPETSLHA